MVMADSTSELFSGLKVIELASVLAGPSVGMFFAELGATVIKIENPRTGGDSTRHWKLPTEDPNCAYSGYFCSVNWGKQHLFADLKTEEGRAQVYTLVADADVVLSNYKPGDDAKLRVDFATLAAINPKLIYGHITGYGDSDQRAAFDVVLQAECGYMELNRQTEGHPVNFPLAMVDILAAHQLKEGLLAALWQRERTGKGAYVTASLANAGISALSNQATNWLMGGVISKRNGSRHPNIAPYGEVVTTSDGHKTVLAVGTQGQFEALCRVLGCENLIVDARFTNVQKRVLNRNALDQLLQAEACRFTRPQLLEKLNQNKVPAGAILRIDEVFEQPWAHSQILVETMPDGRVSKRVATVGFCLKAD